MINTGRSDSDLGVAAEVLMRVLLNIDWKSCLVKQSLENENRIIQGIMNVWRRFCFY